MHALVLAISGMLGLAALIGAPHDASASRQIDSPLDMTDMVSLTMPLSLPDGEDAGLTSESKEAQAATEVRWQEVTIQSGDSLSLIFGRLGLSPRELNSVMQAGAEAKGLQRILPGQLLRFGIDQGQLQSLHYDIDRTRTLKVARAGDRFASTIVSHPVEKRTAYTAGVIEDSLYLAGRRVGLSDNLIMELAGIFGWDIDFALDIRKGDTFNVIFEQEFLEGELLRDGAILAAEFMNQGRMYRAVRFADGEGRVSYYTPEGHSMRKAFLRSPVDFRRISSHFQPERYHPVLGVKRPHRGVDYAAAIGTPIKAAGDGKVVYRGWKGGYGNTVVIQHGERYSTLYGHLSKFRTGVGTGTRVRQGEIIGYVGKTGLATGPHLHYEFLVDGVHRNPLTVKLPNSEPIPEKLRAAFQEQTAPLLAQIEVHKRTQLALQE